MISNLFGNPHSHSPSSLLSTQRVESVRFQALRFFKADPAHFDLVFVANATAGIKLVVDGLQGGDDRNGFWYGYHSDSHTSLVGPRELARAGSRCFQSDNEVEKWINDEDEPRPTGHDHETCPRIRLFAYPAQSNMNGRRLPLDWPRRLRRSSQDCCRKVYTLLDVAAFASTAEVDLSNPDGAPDFVVLSFYKIFGFPDLGALIVRRDSGSVLLGRSYFGGGTVDMVINGDAGEEWVARKQSSLHEALEDGTPAFHSIVALESAFVVHRRLYGSMANVSRHTTKLAMLLYQQLIGLLHADGTRVCEVYKGLASEYGNSKTQAPTITFNVRDRTGGWIGKSAFEQLAIFNGIQLRTGGLCNPGGIAAFLQFSAKEMRHNYDEGLRCGNGIDEMDGKPTGVVRISLGAMSNVKDVQRFMKFMRTILNHDIPLTSKPLSAYPRQPSGFKVSSHAETSQDSDSNQTNSLPKSNVFTEVSRSRVLLEAITFRYSTVVCDKNKQSPRKRWTYFQFKRALEQIPGLKGSTY